MENVTNVEVNVKEYLLNLFNAGNLVKDLYSNDQYREEVCKTCNGTGIKLHTDRFGVGGKVTNGTPLFPHINESIVPCNMCYFGKLKICQHCGKPLDRGYLRCDCKKARYIENKERLEKERQILERAIEASIDDFGMLYSEHYPYNEGYFVDWDDFFESCDEELIKSECRPKYVWGTSRIDMTMDAYSIVENACEDLCEDAMDNIDSKSIAELQTYLNDWISKHGCGPAYAQNEKYKVRIPWEEYSEDNLS